MTERWSADRMSDCIAIKSNIKALRNELKAYPDASLMAVVKTRTGEEIEYAINECGIKLAGENRVQEFLSHEPYLTGADVHFIGTLQKNKVKYLIGKTAVIESVDSAPLALEISKRSLDAGIVTDIFCEVNTGREVQKSGVFPEKLPELLDYCARLPGIKLRGLMTVSPVSSEPSGHRVYFALLRKLGDENIMYFEKKPLLSMGMTDSYREALCEGADIIRIGTGIFGERKKI